MIGGEWPVLDILRSMFKMFMRSRLSLIALPWMLGELSIRYFRHDD
jgi:hypothetical protein